MSNLVEAYIKARPQSLFLIDGLGALISSFLLGILIPQWLDFFGIPMQVLSLLATLPIFFACFDFLSYLMNSNRVRHHLRIISGLNLAYCIISLSLAFYHMDTLTPWGWAYLVSELVLVFLLSHLEYKTSESIELSDEKSKSPDLH